MDTYSLYAIDTGVFTGQRLGGSAAFVASNTPEGLRAHPGEIDHLRQRLDVASGEIVPYVPPAPADTLWVLHAWNADERRWVASPTLASIKRDRCAPLLAAIEACERRQARPLRELLTVQASGSVARLRAIDDEIAALRIRLQAISAAMTVDALAGGIE